jgi:lipoprotein-releasing system permease protein
MIPLAFRYLMSRRRQTILTLLGIFFGTAGYVVISGFFIGFQNYLIQQMVDNSAHIHIQQRDDYLTAHGLDKVFYGDKPQVLWDAQPAGREDNARIENPQGWYARLNADPRVVAYSPQLTASALFTKSKTSVSATLIGCDPLKQSKVTNILDNMVEGNFSDISSGGNRIVVGRELLNELGMRVSQNVLVSVGTNSPAPLKIVGVFSSGNKATDLQAYGSLTDVQKLNRTPNVINEIGVKIKNYNEAAAMATFWSKLFPEKTESWDQQNATAFSMFAMQNTMRAVIIATVMIVAGFGIYNVLMMTVNQKRRDIAILRSMGYGTTEIIWLFLSQGMLLGLAGAMLGLLCGFIVCKYLQTIPFAGPPGSTKMDHLHIALSWSIYLQGSILAILSSSIASFLPAHAAGELTPIEIIRAGD